MAITGKIWHNGTVTDLTDVESLSDIVQDPSHIVWVDLVEPTPDQMAVLSEELGLDPHTLEDTLDRYERPKAMRLDSYTFATVCAELIVDKDAEQVRIEPSRVSAYALPTALLTVRPDSSFDMAPVIRRWQDDRHLIGFGVDGLLQGLLDVIVDQYFEVLQFLDDRIEGLTDQLFTDKPDLRDLQKRAFRMRGALVGLRRVIPPMRDVVTTLIRAGLVNRRKRWASGLLGYYEDLNDHALRASEWLETLSEMVSSVYETNLALNDARMNEVMKKLAGWAAIIAVPTLITGWFGMNVPYWGFGTLAGVISSSVLIVVTAVTLYILFRKNDWL